VQSDAQTRVLVLCLSARPYQVYHEQDSDSKLYCSKFIRPLHNIITLCDMGPQPAIRRHPWQSRTYLKPRIPGTEYFWPATFRRIDADGNRPANMHEVKDKCFEDLRTSIQYNRHGFDENSFPVELDALVVHVVPGLPKKRDWEPIDRAVADLLRSESILNFVQSTAAECTKEWGCIECSVISIITLNEEQVNLLSKLYPSARGWGSYSAPVTPSAEALEMKRGAVHAITGDWKVFCEPNMEVLLDQDSTAWSPILRKWLTTEGRTIPASESERVESPVWWEDEEDEVGQEERSGSDSGYSTSESDDMDWESE
jgi:hypothetical protein